MMRRATVLGVLFGVAQSVSGGGDSAKYLATIGPAPLRIAMAVDAGTKYRMLPLPMGSEPVEEPVKDVITEPSTDGEVPPSEPEKANEAPPIETPVIIEPPPPPEDPPAEPAAPVVTPQMLLRFFSKDGTRETTVITSTNAPAARPSGSSSATYIIK